MKNKFFDTAVGKSVQTFAWTAASYVAAVGLAELAKVHWSDKLVALGVPGLVNWLAYTAKVFVDKEVPNLPSSAPVLVVAAPQPTPAPTPTEPEQK